MVHYYCTSTEFHLILSLDGRSHPPANERQGFLWASRTIHHLAHYAQLYFEQLGSEYCFIQRYKTLLFPNSDVTCHVQLFVETRQSFSSPWISMKIASIITSLIERILFTLASCLLVEQGNDHNHHEEWISHFNITAGSPQSDTQPPPPLSTLKLKDLFKLDVMQKVIGKDLIYTLKVLIGPLHGMNIRNLLWHGFLAPREFQPQLTSLLLLLLLTLYKRLDLFIQKPRFQRQLKAYIKDVSGFESQIKESIALAPVESYLQTHTQNLCYLLQKSQLIVPGWLELWQYGFQLIIERKYYEAMVVLFPILESSLRHQYAQCNQMPQFRLTSEVDTLCISNSIILDKWLEREELIQARRESKKMELKLDGEMDFDLGQSILAQWPSSSMTCGRNTDNLQSLHSLLPGNELGNQSIDSNWLHHANHLYQIVTHKKMRNQLFHLLSRPLCNALFDLFIWRDLDLVNASCPCYHLRDLIAHGALNPESITTLEAMHLVSILIALLDYFSLPKPIPNHLNPPIDLISYCRLQIRDYKPCFHIKTLQIAKCDAIRLYLAKWSKTNVQLFMSFESNSHMYSETKSCQDLIYERELNARIIKYHFLNQYLAYQIRTSAKVDIDHYHHCHFPCTSPMTEKCLSQYHLIHKLLGQIEIVLHTAQRKYQQVIKRCDWKKQRRMFSVQSMFNQVLASYTQFLLLVIEIGLYHEDVSLTLMSRRLNHEKYTTLSFLLSILNSIQSNIELGNFKRAEEIIECILSKKPKHQAKYLARNESQRYWLDLEHVIYKMRIESQALSQNSSEEVDLEIVVESLKKADESRWKEWTKGLEKRTLAGHNDRVLSSNHLHQLDIDQDEKRPRNIIYDTINDQLDSEKDKVPNKETMLCHHQASSEMMTSAYSLFLQQHHLIHVTCLDYPDFDSPIMDRIFN